MPKIMGLLVCMLGCAASSPTPRPQPKPLPTTPIAVDSGPIVLRELPTLQAKVTRKAKTTRVPFGGASGATIAPDGKTFFIDASDAAKPGGFIVSEAHPQGVHFGTSEVHDARFSDDGKRLMIYNDERDVVSVLEVPDAVVVEDVTHAKAARFDGANLITWHGCQLTRAGVAIGPTICGGADGSDDGRTWMVVEPESRGRPMGYRDYTKLTWIDVHTGAARVLFTKSGERGLRDLRLSPKGDFVCFTERMFRCLHLLRDHAEPVQVPDLDAFALSWDDEGGRFVAAPFRFNDIVVVDFIARTIRHVAIDADYRHLALLPGGKRLFVYDKGGWVIDLATGDAIEIFPKSVEVGGFVPVPHRDDRFMTGNEVGASRGYFWVDL